MKEAADALLVTTLAGTETGEPSKISDGSTVVKDYFLLRQTLELSAMCSKAKSLHTEAAIAAAAYEKAAGEIREVGDRARAECVGVHGVRLGSVRIPFTFNGEHEEAIVSSSSKFSVDKTKFASKREQLQNELGADTFGGLFGETEVLVVTRKGLDILRGLLSKAGLNGKQIDAAIDQICDREKGVVAKPGFDEVVEKLDEPKKKLVAEVATRAKSAVRV